MSGGLRDRLGPILGRRGPLRCARQFLCYFRRRTLNCNAVLIIEADLALAHLVPVHNGTNERGLTNSGLEVSADSKRTNLQHPCELLPLFGDGGMDRSGNRLHQGRFCGRAQVQGATHFVRKHFCRRFYSLGGAVGCGLHGAARDRWRAEERRACRFY